MRNVLIYAYTAFNLGDDLFVKILCERYPGTNFAIVAPKNYRLIFKQCKNLHVYPSDSLPVRGIDFALRTARTRGSFRDLIARRYDAIVRIGGSLFIQQENWKKKRVVKEITKRFTKPHFLVGANFGPYSDVDYWHEHREVFSDYADVCFRDTYSYHLFEDLGNVRMAPDIVFQLGRKLSSYQTFQTDDGVVISVIKPSVRPNLRGYDEIYYTKIAEISSYLVAQGYSVTLMSFCKNEDDESAVENIAAKIPERYSTKVYKHYYTLNIEEALGVISRSRLVIATRFHAMILGWVFNKPVFPIAYSSKMTNVMKDTGFQGSYVEVRNIADIEPAHVIGCIKTNLMDVSDQIISSEKHFERLDRLLKE